LQGSRLPYKVVIRRLFHLPTSAGSGLDRSDVVLPVTARHRQ
jgi:hypothetical protein